MALEMALESTFFLEKEFERLDQLSTGCRYAFALTYDVQLRAQCDYVSSSRPMMPSGGVCSHIDCKVA
jgi:hypothetical protein